MTTENIPPVLILHNIPRPRPAGAAGTSVADACAESDAGVLDEVRAVQAALEKHGAACRVAGLRTLRDLPGVLANSPEPVVFNLVEGFHDRNEDANLVPAVCQAFAKACTGGDTPCLTLALDKWQSKSALQSAGLPTPPAGVVQVGQAPADAALPRGRCIVKPLRCDASEGIDASSVVDSPSPQLDAAVRRIHTRFAQPALVEQFFGQRELNVSVLERQGRVEVMPLAEIDFKGLPDGYPPIMGYAEKWLTDSDEYRRTPRVIPAPLPEPAAQRIRELAVRAWHAFGCRDYIRIEFRLDDQLDPSILEINPNPDVSPDAGLAAAVQAGGLAYDQFVLEMVANAMARKLDAAAPPSPSGARGKPKVSPSAITLRWSQKSDREGILSFMAATGFFRDDEIVVAAEVLDEALAKGPGGHYTSLTALEDGVPVGWVCFGLTPCTLATYDIYWIGVAPDRQGKGIGALLLQETERQISARGGLLAILETSGRVIYDPTRKFYLRMGYYEAGRVPDFYALGDDKTIYVKRL